MTFSVFDLFTIGIGPSSSHTLGPMLAARRFATALHAEGMLDRVERIRVELFGSLGATGWGHGTGSAVLLGLEGAQPRTVGTATVAQRVNTIRKTGCLVLLREDGLDHRVLFDEAEDLVRHQHTRLDFHPNAMRFDALAGSEQIFSQTWYSIGGGAVVCDDGRGSVQEVGESQDWPYPFRRAAQLVEFCDENAMSIPEIMLANELTRRSEAEVLAGLDEIWQVMCACIDAGCHTSGTLPGGLFVGRRAPQLYKRLVSRADLRDPLIALDEVSLWALAVNEENAAGGRMVTAPTNGAAGVIPAVLRYAVGHLPGNPVQMIREFLLVAGAIGSVFRSSASISGAEVGCQGEVGTACAMAAAALAHLMGATSQQAVNAAEIGLEHHLGLTCDPIGGLVQIPCIERNAIATVKAITAARLAVADDGYQFVSLDGCIRTMMQTGLDMMSKYKETSQGGLAVNIVEC